MLTRRAFLASAAMAAGVHGVEPKRKTILLVSSWQTVNIGDIAHTPGMLHVLEREAPDVNVILWPKSIDRGVEGLLRKRFPKVRIVKGAKTGDGPTLDEALKEADLLLHGSGPSLVGSANVDRWTKETGKPWGAIGVTLYPESSPEYKARLDTAAFLFTRETKSLAALKAAKCKCPIMDFAPDATFAVDLADDEAAAKLIKEHDLEPGKFLCAIPRLRYTPYWETHPERVANAKEKIAVNEKHAEPDAAKLRAAITAWVRATKLRVLLCPEMTYQTPLLKPLLYEKLPDDVKPFVTAMNRYWLTDEASSVYKQCRMLIGSECHSPILTITHDRPAFYVRQPEDTYKGQMYPDLGLGEWAPEIDTIDGNQLAERVLKVETDEPAARKLARTARLLAEAKLRDAMTVMKKTLG